MMHRSRAKLIDELTHCAVLCANCHRKVTFGATSEDGLVPLDRDLIEHYNPKEAISL